MARWDSLRFCSGDPGARGTSPSSRPLVNCSAPPFPGGVSVGGLPPAVKIVTWLILPVVICLSQRLSHASLSISNYTVKLRMAHYISYCLFDSTLLHG